MAWQLRAWLAGWHSASVDHRSLPQRLLEDRDNFEVLRPQRRPEVAGAILALTERIRGSHLCLVHGDFSPKNVLLAPPSTMDRGFWVIDFEVAHLGDPVFDLAFAVSHLLLKAAHRPKQADNYDGPLDALAAIKAGLTPRWSVTARTAT